MNTEDKFYFGKPGQMASDIIKAQGHRFKITNDGGYKKIYVEDAGEPGGWLFLRSVRPDQDAARMIEVGAESGPVHKWAHRFSRPGSPDKFDASSLDRGNFAEASKSPMLGKLLAAKAMPDGGWRAVQVGSDTLVISFEDADLARDFGRRVASKGYSATSPVATTGRYWNVEVKNGK